MRISALLLIFLIFRPASFWASDDKQKPLSRVITGQVVAENGEVVPGATIVIAETGEQFFADMDGNFSLTVRADKPYSVEISTVGFQVLRLNTRDIISFSQQVLAPLH
jgi:hypothetical protein